MSAIVQQNASVLRAVAAEVDPALFGSKKLATILKRMRNALDAQEDGVALAAPQIGLSLRIFIVSPKAYAHTDKDTPTVFINPRITKRSKKSLILEEGCLSVRWLYGEVRRASHVTIEAYDERGKSFVRGAGGLLSQIFQHETDHLDGVLFIDKAQNLREIPPETLQSL